MKSFNGLWDQMMTTENIIESIENAHEGKGKKLKKKRYRLLVKLYEHRYEEETQNTVRRWIYEIANVYNPNWHRPPIEIKDGPSGKIRKIYVPTVKELVVQHCVVNVLKKILLPMLGSQVYGSIPGKGSQKAVQKMMEFIREHPEQCKYCVKMDHKKYFDSIPQQRLMHKLRKKIRDNKFYCLLCIIIMYIPNMKGLPIGFYTSQLLGVWYLYDSDEYVNNTLKHEGVSYCTRWMDDVYFFGPDKRDLEQCMYKYILYTRIHQDLHIKDNWQCFRFSYRDSEGNYHGRFLDCMGYRVYCDRVILRESIMFNMVKKANRMARARHITIGQCKSMLSYNGYLKVTKTYSMYLKFIKPKISFKYLRKRVSAYDRRINGMENRSRNTGQKARAA